MIPCSVNPLDPFGTVFVNCLASYVAKMLQRTRNVLKITGRRCYKRIRNVLQVTGRRCYNLSGTPCQLLGEDVKTYQERLENYWTKMLQRIRNVLQVTGRRCYNVSGTSCKLLDEDATTYQEIVIDNADHRTLLHPSKPFPKRTMCKSDSSPAPRGAPSPKTARPRSSAA